MRVVPRDEVREGWQTAWGAFRQRAGGRGHDHRLAQDWSGDESIFVDVVLNRSAPPAAVVARLSEQIGAALLRVVLRSEESRPDNRR